ncbi:nuclease-related domain-containing protein [Pseudoneobacillus sp. C159]
MKGHQKIPLMEQELNRLSAGLWGEREVDRRLLRIDQERYLIIRGLRLPNGDGTFFQIDTLVISTRFILIIEAKNIAGAIYFDLANHQFYRILDGKQENLSDPVSQARLHQQQLQQWLSKHKFPSIFIDFLVASTNPHSIYTILQPEHPYAEKICNSAGLTWKVDNLEDYYKKEILTDKDIRKIAKALLKAHTPLPPSNILQQYDLAVYDFRTGVFCPDCEHAPLKYRCGKWHCARCNKRFNDDVLIEAVDDYLLVISPKMTNSEFRAFVGLEDRVIASKKLRKLSLQVYGSNKGRYYQRNF